MNLDDEQDRDVAAGEYVMGTLVSDEREVFERALASDARVQQAVYAWQDRLLGLAARAAPVAPPAGLWDRIEQRLTGRPAVAVSITPGAGNAVGNAGGKTADNAGKAAANDASWRGERLWKAVSGLAIAASLVLATLLVLRPPATSTEPAARYLALLQAPDKSTGWVVEATAGQGVKLVPVGSTAAVPEGKTLQFWTKAEGATGPTSLGLVQVGQTVAVPLAQLPALEERQLFELTLEPSGGSTIGRPTGPILFVGRTVRL